MAINDITYAASAALANISRLHSNANTTAEAFGEILLAGEISENIHVIVPINSAATDGSYDLYMVMSQDGVNWTDGIDPATAGDVAAKISDARFITSANTTYNATNRTDAELIFNVSALSSAKYIGFVLDNNSGQTIPATGASGDSVAIKIASA